MFVLHHNYLLLGEAERCEVIVYVHWGCKGSTSKSKFIQVPAEVWPHLMMVIVHFSLNVSGDYFELCGSWSFQDSKNYNGTLLANECHFMSSVWAQYQCKVSLPPSFPAHLFLPILAQSAMSLFPIPQKVTIAYGRRPEPTPRRYIWGHIW
jgi:hypothetical protein